MFICLQVQVFSRNANKMADIQWKTKNIIIQLIIIILKLIVKIMNMKNNGGIIKNLMIILLDPKTGAATKTLSNMKKCSF